VAGERDAQPTSGLELLVGKMIRAEVGGCCRRGEDELAPAGAKCSRLLMRMASAAATRCREADLVRGGGGAVELCGLAE
jgi:hypothetical protein